MDKFSKIRRILIVTLGFNWLVALSKIIYGIVTRCAAMKADGFHSFGDGTSNIIGLIGIWIASRPEDDSHPYGHRKFETIATLGIAVMLFIVSFDIIKDAISRFFHPVIPDVTGFSFVLMAVTLFINFLVMNYELKKGRELSSDILVCDSIHTRSDILSSLIVISALVSVRLGFYKLDAIVAALIGGFIAYSALRIVKESSDVLCDASAVSCSRISALVRRIPGVHAVHKVRTRGRGDDIHVDLHVMTDAGSTIEDAHELMHTIERELKDRIKGVTDVVIHIEPHNRLKRQR